MKFPYTKQLILSSLLMLAIISVHADTYTISGYIRDIESAESLIGATVLDVNSQKGTLANVHGFYSITLPEGAVDLEYSYVSYRAQKHSFVLSEDTTINIAFSGITELDEVTLVAKRNELGVKGTQMSAIEVPITQIKNIPALAGEVDVIKAIQLLPGVQSGSEGATGLYVRGGGPDQNLMLLDGVPLYNVNHLFGFFSVFNADAIKNVTLYKGNFPARFGSRLSSVVDVRQNEGNAQTYHGSVTLGLLSAKVNLEGPIIKNKTTFNISARRTYFDILAQPIFAFVNSQQEEKANGGYYFYDVNAKVTHKFSEKDKLSTSFYMGDDAIYMKMRSDYDGVDAHKSHMKFDWDWGNLLGSVNWSHQFSNRLFSNLVASYTRYRYDVGINVKDVYVDESMDMNIDYMSNIQDVTLNYDLDYFPHPNHTVKVGTNYIYHTFCPEVGSFKMNTTGLPAFDEKSGGNITNTHEWTMYAEDNWTINDILKLNLGLRGSVYAAKDKTYPALEPRVGLRTLINNNLSFKASYSYMSQYIHLLSGSNITLPTDIWVPVTSRTKPMLSHQGAAGVFYNLLDVVDLSVEGYYKHMNNVLEYKDGATFFASSESWEDKVCVGEGWSYGVEFLAQRSIGRFSGWVGYTWSKTQRRFDREGMQINYGNVFYAKYDRRNDVSIVAQYQLNKRIDFATTFVYGTGTRASLGTQIYETPLGDVEYLPERNNYTMPDYLRVDFGVNFRKEKKRWGGERIWNISVYNVMNRNNPFFVYPGNNGKLTQVSIFPILPSVSYTYKF